MAEDRDPVLSPFRIFLDNDRYVSVQAYDKNHAERKYNQEYRRPGETLQGVKPIV